MKSIFRYTFLLGLTVLLTFNNNLFAQDFSVAFEKFTLDNGLEVIFHEDKSDPVVAVALTFHVGSARELEGKTGFAHLFEHLLFLNSENLGQGGLDAMSSRIGGSGANGSTSRDWTNYFQTVPNDALEKMIWAEADKLGFFINTVTDRTIAIEKQVVKNEKRQVIDNRPYGHAMYVVGKNMYPADHPYSWQVIGSLADIQSATLSDVKGFYDRWYVPNNATLVIAGDFDFDQAKEWVHKYFDEIPRGEEIERLETRLVSLDETVKVYHEDNFARLPELRMVWPGVELYNEDSYALEILFELLTDGKKAPLNQVLVDEKQLTSSVNYFNYFSEIAGDINLIVRAFPGTDLNEVHTALEEGFERFETNGFSETDLNRIKAGIETQFYNGLSSVLGKAIDLGQYSIYTGDPGFINEISQKTLAVTSEDVMQVYNQYIKGRDFVATSFVPLGQTDLVLDGSVRAIIEEEVFAEGSNEEPELPEATDFNRTPSSFDRSIEPIYGESPETNVPEIWEMTTDNGIPVHGITNEELPLVQFQLRLKGGLLLENPDKVGVSNLVAELMTRGTANKTPEELEEAINVLGASINVSAGSQSIVISGNTLARNYQATMDLVEEILLEPRWDETEFDLAKQSTMSAIAAQSADPNSIAFNTFNKLVYGDENILSNSLIGTTTTVENITIEDLKEYYYRSFSPTVASYLIVGATNDSEVREALAGISNRWESKVVDFPELSFPEAPNESQVYFYDVPGATQSVFRFGYLAMPETDPDFFPSNVMNYILGGGGFASRLMLEVREAKGYTYGISTRYSGTDLPGTFALGSNVRADVTLDASLLIKEIMEKYPSTFTETDLENTKSSLLKSNARRFETLGAKLSVLRRISAYDWDPDYVKEQEQIVRDITVEDISELASTYADPGKMIYLVVGDAATQMSQLEDLGFGEPILVNENFREGNE
jgi:zinc protease